LLTLKASLLTLKASFSSFVNDFVPLLINIV